MPDIGEPTVRTLGQGRFYEGHRLGGEMGKKKTNTSILASCCSHLLYSHCITEFNEHKSLPPGKNRARFGGLSGHIFVNQSIPTLFYVFLSKDILFNIYC